MAWPEPQYSKRMVKRSGKYFRDNPTEDFSQTTTGQESLQVLSNWRDMHGAVLNTAQAWIRRLDRSTDIIVAQRLKRFDTVLDKLVTGRSDDLSTMHDIAGVRVIFKNEDALREFRKKMEKSRAKHPRKNEVDDYDYIKCPKDTGYRGVHDVYERRCRTGIAYNGLKFEVQLRTNVQHAWATAVEIYDLSKGTRLKFSSGDAESDVREYFSYISELLARIHEDSAGRFLELSIKDLQQKCLEMEEATKVVTSVKSLHAATRVGKIEKNSVLYLTKNRKLYAKKFPSMPIAMKALKELEMREDIINIVLVGAQDPKHIKNAFRNYFTDAAEFVELFEEALGKVI